MHVPKMSSEFLQIKFHLMFPTLYEQLFFYGSYLRSGHQKICSRNWPVVVRTSAVVHRIDEAFVTEVLATDSAHHWVEHDELAMGAPDQWSDFD
jgi:hypothetical protein